MASEPQGQTEDTSSNLDHAGFQYTAGALKSLTTDAAANHNVSPQGHLHAPAGHEKSHAWLAKHFPTAAASAKLQYFENKFHFGNYVIDRKTGEKIFEAMSMYVRIGMHLLYYGSAQERALHWKETERLLEEQSVKMGKEYDSPASKDHIIPFIRSFDLETSLPDMVEPDPTKYPNFNEFFAREIKASARPIDEPSNDLVASSVADCRLTTFPTIDLATQYWIKGRGFTLSGLLGDEQLAKQFDGGSILIHRLAPQDYHRWHAPVTGIVEHIKEIPGTYYTVNPQAINEPGTLDVFCENRRSVMSVRRTATDSPVVIVAVGAMLVGSIKYVEGAEVGKEIKRGQCIGKFLYGGSTVITLFPKGEITLDQDLVRNSIEKGCETLVRVGWRVGVKS